MQNKAIFLDRDDTLIEDPGYINHPDQIKVLDGVAEALAELKGMGYKLVVVSNQSGVARGIVTEDVLGEIHERLRQELAEKNAYLDRIYYCPYHPEGVIPKYRKESDCRKPNPGMLLNAAKEMKIDLGQSWMVGNSIRDVEAGLRAGCKTILIDHSLRPKQVRTGEPKPDYCAVNLREGVNIIKKHLRSPKPVIPVIPMIQSPVSASEAVEPEEIKEIEPVQEPAIATISEEPMQEEIFEPEAPETVSDAVSDARVKEIPADKSSEKLEHLLETLIEQLKRMQREDMFGEFSMMRFFAGMMQIVAAGCVLIGVLLLLSSVRNDNLIFISLGFAAVLQLIALTLYIMQGRK